MKKGLVIFCFLVLVRFHLLATAQPHTFRQFPNACFVETGSYLGEGIQWALDAGFSQIISIELEPSLHEYCKKQFSQFQSVHLVHGDTSFVLHDVIKDIHTPITFWLDAHYSGISTAKGNSYSPILLELEAIKMHPIKNHTILIDDVRLMGTYEFDFVTLDQIINKIKDINPNYQLSFLNGYVENDILVAQVK